jgi:hypothetical protein
MDNSIHEQIAKHAYKSVGAEGYSGPHTLSLLKEARAAELAANEDEEGGPQCICIRS